MRWFFILLLITNIGYVAWELNRDRSQPVATAALPKNVERIMLLSELEPEPEPDPGPAASDASVADELVEDDASSAALAPSAELAEISQRLAEAMEALPEDSGEVVDSTAPGGDVAVDEAAEEAVETPVEKPAAERCYTLGPFREMNTLRVVTREIKDYVIEASFRSREEQEQSMFRVYLKPVGSKKEARALIKKLNSKKIRDHFIITEGPLKNGISLGYFSDKKRAYKHAGRVRKHGFDAVIEPVFRTYTIYWLDYRIEAGNEIPKRIFDQHLDNTTQRLSRSCV